jgi:hypothetical protein
MISGRTDDRGMSLVMRQPGLFVTCGFGAMSYNDAEKFHYLRRLNRNGKNYDVLQG